MLRFDPTDPEFNRNPHPVLKRFREESPIHFWEQGHGHIVFRYRDVMALFREPRLITDPTLGAGFPEEMRQSFPDFVDLRSNDLFMASPEDHARIRRLVNPYFGPRAVVAHREKIASIIQRELEELPQEGVVNVFEDFAARYPVRVIASLLGIPRGDEDTFLAFAKALIATIIPGLPPEVFASYMPAASRGIQLVRQLIQERRKTPVEGELFSNLINACDQEERLSDGELMSLVSGLLIGGSDTTVHLTTYTIHELLRHPDQLALLREDPSLARLALDETLRFNSFGRGGGLPRFVTENFTYEGVELHRGQPVYFNMLSAFRDSDFVPDADVYDIRRRTNSSPWFGFGPHFCLGASLARLEAELALQLFFARYPEVELVGEAVYGTHPVLRDIVDLPVRVGSGVTSAV